MATYLFAVLLYGPIMRRMADNMAAGMPESHAIIDAIDTIIMSQVRRVAIPKRFT